MSKFQITKRFIIYFRFLDSFTTTYFRFVQVSRYIDTWLNTNDPPAPSGGPTQSPPEGAGGTFVNTYTVLHIFRQVLFWAGN